MRIIAFMNQKGGVGKTTTTVNLGAALAEAGKKVCLVDLDPQSHLTINYGVDPSAEQISLYQVLVEQRSFLEAIQRVGKNIALVPGNIDLAAAEVELVNVPGREMLLKNRIAAAQHDFDFILLDCPPSLGLLTINALAVAEEVIIPMQPHFLALQGVGKLLETVALVNKRMNPKLKVSGIVLTMFDAQTKLCTEVVNDLSNFITAAEGKNLPWSAARIFQSKIRRNIKLAESPSFGQTILQYDGTSHGSMDYRSLAREVIQMAKPVVPALAAAAQVAGVQPAVTTKAVAEVKPVVEVKPPAAPMISTMAAVPVAAEPKLVATKPVTPKSVTIKPTVPKPAPAATPAVSITVNPTVKTPASKTESVTAMAG